jgi:hypothetical protein
MKTTLNRTAALIAALVLSTSTSIYAGPGPQFWAQQHAKAAPATDAKAKSKMDCTKCTDSTITAVRPAVAGGKVAARTEIVGTKHTCAACGGETKTVAGTTTNTMQSNCPVCAKAEGCCNVAG